MKIIHTMHLKLQKFHGDTKFVLIAATGYVKDCTLMTLTLLFQWCISDAIRYGAQNTNRKKKIFRTSSFFHNPFKKKVESNQYVFCYFSEPRVLSSNVGFNIVSGYIKMLPVSSWVLYIIFFIFLYFPGSVWKQMNFVVFVLFKHF